MKITKLSQISISRKGKIYLRNWDRMTDKFEKLETITKTEWNKIKENIKNDPTTPTIINPIPKSTGETLTKNKRTLTQELCIAYTDGSYDPLTNKAGYAIRFIGTPENNEIARITGIQNIYRAEAQAISRVLDIIHEDQKIQIITDSLSVANTIEKVEKKEKLRVHQSN